MSNFSFATMFKTIFNNNTFILTLNFHRQRYFCVVFFLQTIQMHHKVYFREFGAERFKYVFCSHCPSKPRTFTNYCVNLFFIALFRMMYLESAIIDDHTVEGYGQPNLRKIQTKISLCVRAVLSRSIFNVCFPYERLSAKTNRQEILISVCQDQPVHSRNLIQLYHVCHQ